MYSKLMRPNLADTPLQGAQMRALVPSGKQALELAQDATAAARWVRSHPGGNLLFEQGTCFGSRKAVGMGLQEAISGGCTH